MLLYNQLQRSGNPQAAIQMVIGLLVAHYSLNFFITKHQMFLKSIFSSTFQYYLINIINVGAWSEKELRPL
ncbi:MAG: hypothetical protein PWP31_549 [Clostridia bacterium]|nr:hypothetical protein [Clostridia bacterium]